MGGNVHIDVDVGGGGGGGGDETEPPYWIIIRAGKRLRF